jgi:hypothetical protein
MAAEETKAKASTGAEIAIFLNIGITFKHLIDSACFGQATKVRHRVIDQHQ